MFWKFCAVMDIVQPSCESRGTENQGWKEWQDLGRQQINVLEPVAVSQLPGKCSVELCGVPSL